MKITNLTAFERGQLDYRQGRRECPFKQWLKVEQWADGWKTEQAQR